jgi:hypothetical protein
MSDEAVQGKVLMILSRDLTRFVAGGEIAERMVRGHGPYSATCTVRTAIVRSTVSHLFSGLLLTKVRLSVASDIALTATICHWNR